MVWRARLNEHLGHYAVEPLHLHGASQLAVPHVVYGVTHLAALCRLLPERDPHPEVHDHLAAMLDQLEDPLAAGTEMVRFELQMLAELGFGLDLAAARRPAQVGPWALRLAEIRARRVTEAGQPWQDGLPVAGPFLSEAIAPSLSDIADGFALTGFFLERHVLEPRGIGFAEAREGFVAAVLGRVSRAKSRSNAASPVDA